MLTLHWSCWTTDMSLNWSRPCARMSTHHFRNPPAPMWLLRSRTLTSVREVLAHPWLTRASVPTISPVLYRKPTSQKSPPQPPALPTPGAQPSPALLGCIHGLLSTLHLSLLHPTFGKNSAFFFPHHLSCTAPCSVPNQLTCTWPDSVASISLSNIPNLISMCSL